jgi:hypothetical protein
MLTFRTLLFRRLRLCLTPEFLRGALAVLCLAAFGCGHGKVHSAQMSFPAPAISPQPPSGELMQVAAGFAQFFLHDNCTAQYPPQPDTCLHDRLHEQSFTFGGKPGTVYDVTLRIRAFSNPPLSPVATRLTPHTHTSRSVVRSALWIGPSGESKSRNPNKRIG